MFNARILREKISLVALRLRAPHTHSVERDQLIRRRISGVKGSANYLILGDSNALNVEWRAARGAQPVNASFSGGTVSTFLYAGRGPTYLRLCRPLATVIALGVNDARSLGVGEFVAVYEKLIDALSGPIIVCGIPLVELVPNAAEFNAALRDMTARRSLAFVEPAAHLGAVDGLHLATQAYPAWIAAVEDALSRTVPWK